MTKTPANPSLSSPPSRRVDSPATTEARTARIERALGRVPQAKEIARRILDQIEQFEQIFRGSDVEQFPKYGETEKQLDALAVSAGELAERLRKLNVDAESTLRIRMLADASIAGAATLLGRPDALDGLAAAAKAEAARFYKLASAGGKPRNYDRRILVEMLLNAWPSTLKVSAERDSTFGKVATEACAMMGDWTHPSRDFLKSVIENVSAARSGPRVTPSKPLLPR